MRLSSRFLQTTQSLCYMQPITINVNVKLSLDDQTLTVVRGLTGAASAALEQPVEPKPEKTPDSKAPVTQPAPEAAPAPAPEKPSGGEISDEFLREKVKEAKDRKGAKAVRDVFAQMNITSSVECPQGRRSELVAMLENLR